MKPLILLLSMMSLASFKVAVTADVETDPVKSFGDAADDTTVWVHPQDVSKSVIVGTDKKWGLNVYDLNGKKVSSLAAGDVNNVDSRAGFSFAGEKIQVLAGSARNTDSIDFYQLNPNTQALTTIGSLKLSYEPYGICLGFAGMDPDLHVFITTKSGLVDQWSVQTTGTTLSFTQKQQWKMKSTTEGCVVDDSRGHLYVGEEKRGLWKISLVDAAVKPFLIDQVGSGGHLVADVEGVAIYDMPHRQSYLMVSSQGDNSFHVYNLDTNAYRGRFTLTSSSTIDGVNDTDGIDISSASFNSQFPEGLMIAQDGSNQDPSGKSQYQNFKVVDWRKVRMALDLQ